MAGMSAEDALNLSKSYVKKTLQGAGALKGEPGRDGVDGQDGADGKSAYDIWLEQGNTGTEEDFLNSLKGESVGEIYSCSCEVIYNSDGTSEVSNFTGDFDKMQAAYSNGNRLQVLVKFNTVSNYILELSYITSTSMAFTVATTTFVLTLSVRKDAIPTVRYGEIKTTTGTSDNPYFIVNTELVPGETSKCIFDKTFAEIKAAFDAGKMIQVRGVISGDTTIYIFNLLYVSENSIAFDCMNSAGKSGLQINISSDDSTGFVITNLSS